MGPPPAHLGPTKLKASTEHGPARILVVLLEDGAKLGLARQVRDLRDVRAVVLLGEKQVLVCQHCEASLKLDTFARDDLFAHVSRVDPCFRRRQRVRVFVVSVSPNMSFDGLALGSERRLGHRSFDVAVGRRKRC
jgi:hypothetical protein